MRHAHKRKLESPPSTPSSKRPALPHEAAKVIQKYWRNRFGMYTASRVVAVLRKLGLSKEQMASRPANDIFNMINSKKYNKYLVLFISKLIILCKHKTPSLPSVDACITQIPMGALSRAWVLTCRAQVMISQHDQYSDELLKLAHLFVMNMETIMTGITDGKYLSQVDPALMFQWHEKMSIYVKSYKSWKKHDLICLEERTKSSLNTMYLMRNSYWQELRMNQRVTQVCNKEIGVLESVLRNNCGNAVWDKFCRENKDIREPKIKMFTMPGASQALNETTVCGLEGINVMQMCHEVLLDPKYTFEKDMRHVEFQYMNRFSHDPASPFWGNTAKDMLLPIPVYSKLILLLEDIFKVTMRSLRIPAQKERLKEVMDIPYIHDQLCRGLYGAGSCKGLIHNVALLMSECYPSEKQAEADVFLQEVKGCMDKISPLDGGTVDMFALVQGVRLLHMHAKTVSMEVASVALKRVLPLKPEDGIRTVHRLFMANVEKKRYGTVLIKRAFQKHLALLKEKNAVTMEDILLNKRLVMNKVMVEVFFEVLTQREMLTEQNVPETYLYSLHLYTYLRKKIESIIVMATIMANLHGVLQRKQIDVHAFMQKVVELFYACQTTFSTMENIVREILGLMGKTNGFSPELLKICEGIMLQGGNLGNPVYVLMRKRIHQIIKNTMESHIWPVMYSEVKNIHPNLVLSLKKLTIEKIVPLKRVNLEVHMPLYLEFCV